MTEALRALEEALRVLRVPSTPGEYDIHRMVAGALADAGIPYAHEVKLAPRCRVDFVALGVGIEIKKGAVSARALRAQAQRYLCCEQISGLILITTRGANLPPVLCGKPVSIFGLNRLWGVSL